MHVHEFVSVHAQVHMYGSQRPHLSVLPYCSLSFLRQGLSRNLVLTNLAK